MVWDRFQLACRLHGRDAPAAPSPPGASLDALYGSAPPAGSVAFDLLRAIESIEDEDERTGIARALGELDYSSALAEPRRLERVTGYLGLLAALLAGMSGIFQYFVAPQFAELFADADYPTESFLNRFLEQGHVLAIVVVLLVLALWTLSVKVKRLFRFSAPTTSIALSDLLLPRRIRTLHARTVEAIVYPLREQLDAARYRQSHLTTELSMLEASGLALGHERAVIVQREAQKLRAACEHLLRDLNVAMSALMVASIGSYVLSVYLPIFKLGELY